MQIIKSIPELFFFLIRARNRSFIVPRDIYYFLGKFIFFWKTVSNLLYSFSHMFSHSLSHGWSGAWKYHFPCASLLCGRWETIPQSRNHCFWWCNPTVFWWIFWWFNFTVWGWGLWCFNKSTWQYWGRGCDIFFLELLWKPSVMIGQFCNLHSETLNLIIFLYQVGSSSSFPRCLSSILVNILFSNLVLLSFFFHISCIVLVLHCPEPSQLSSVL